MEERIIRLEERVGRIETDVAELKSDVRRIDNKVDALTGVVADLDKRMQLGFAATDKRFVEVEARMEAGFAAVDKRFVEMDAKLDKIVHGTFVGRLIERFWWSGIALLILGVLARAMNWI